MYKMGNKSTNFYGDAPSSKQLEIKETWFKILHWNHTDSSHNSKLNKTKGDSVTFSCKIN